MGKRKEALALGLPFYGPTKPCKYGHLSMRETHNAHCLECQSVNLNRYCQAWRDRNRERYRTYMREYQRVYYAKNRVHLLAQQAVRRRKCRNARQIAGVV